MNRQKIIVYTPGRWFRLPDPAGSFRKDAGNSPEMAGSWNQYASRKLPGFFRWIPAKFLCFSAGSNRKSLKKIRKIPYRKTASMKSPECLGTGRFRAGMFDLGYVDHQIKWQYSLHLLFFCYVRNYFWKKKRVF